MDKDIEKLISKMENPAVPGDLLSKIMKRIGTEERIIALKKMYVFSASAAASAVALFFAFKSVWTDSIESGFFNYFSLLFSDFQIIAVHWQNYSLSLLETLPAASLAVFLVSALFLINFIKLLAEDVRRLAPKHS